MKSSGISLYKMMFPAFIGSIIVALLLFQFNNKVLPDANHQAKILMSDISRTKPTLSLEPGFFSQEVSNYAILVRGIDQKTNELSVVTIYDYTNPSKISVVTAEKGKIFFAKDQTRLIMDLYKGEIHESDVQNTTLYRKLKFEKHKITMNADQFSFQQSGPTSRGERELSVEDMRAITDSLNVMLDEQVNVFVKETNKYLFKDSVSFFKPAEQKNKVADKELIYVRSLERIKTAKNVVLANFNRLEWTNREIEKYEVEIYKKYALPGACIIFMLIGAPLGVMVRKGGFGVAAGISLFFFLIYWAFLIGGEKLSERGFFSPFIGMWAANIVLGIAGIILTIKTNKEVKTISFDFLKKLVPKQLRQKDESVQDEDSR
jgi:lipopolysaccharide export system permease protein